MASDNSNESKQEHRDQSGREPGDKKTVDGQRPLLSENWVRFVVPSVLTVVIGILTLWMDSQITERAEQQQVYLTERAEKEQRSRLYTQLLSNREQSSSGMRKDMFVTILGGFLSDKPGDSGSDNPRGVEHLDTQLLKLELLALNFGETLSLSPLFAMMDRRIRTRAYYDNNTEWKLDKAELEGRLSSLARRVADAQRSSLAENSDDFKIRVPINKSEMDEFIWPVINGPSERNACLVLDGIQRKILLKFSDTKKRAKKIDVRLSMETFSLAPGAPEECPQAIENCTDMPESCSDFVRVHVLPTTKPFTIDRFNLPLIDNSLLSNDQRFALVMRDFNLDNDEVEIVGILFPGQYAGRRDKLTLDQAIEQLKGDLK